MIYLLIYSRVPGKSIARFRCLSKFWKSILGRPDFTELFLTKSVARPRLFFVVAVYKDGLHIHENELVVFSSPQPQNPNDNSSLVATRYKTFPKYFPPGMLRMHCGLVFLQNWKTNARVIFNPATGESITLPKVEATGIDYSYLGFDPFSKQSKVLCMTWYGTPNTHQVLTLGTGQRKWRNVQDPLVPPRISDEGICINGLLYYKAYFEGSYSFNIVCFDFRIEKFSLINMAEDMLSYYFRDYRLIFFNNKGKLGAIKYIERGDEKLIVLWVLEDAGKHKWSKRECVLPPFWDNIIKKQRYKTVGMTGTGEIVFTPYKVSKHFHVFYYNIERSTFTRVNIHGFGEFKGRDPAIGTSLDYVETVQGFIT